MKPNANIQSRILNNLSVQGKFNQENIIVGKGLDEIITLQLNNGIGIRYIPNQETGIGSIEYTDDGIKWTDIGINRDISYEPIFFEQKDIRSNGTVKIQHNFKDNTILCLGYCPKPKEIVYLDNELILDYSDQNGSDLTGVVWFIGSKQSMLIGSLSNIPSDGIVFYAPLSEEKDKADIGGLISKFGKSTYTVMKNIPCVRFTTKDSYFQIETNLSESLTSFTVSMWIYMPMNSGVNCSEYPRFFWLGNTKNAYSFLCGTSTPGLSNHVLNFQTIDRDGNWPSSNVDVEKGRWYHVCGVVENGTILRTYLDGIQGPEVIEMSYAITISKENTYVWLNYISNDLGLDDVYIAAVRVYNRVLSEKEIITLSNEFVPDYSESEPDVWSKGVIFYAPFSDDEEYVEIGKSISKTGSYEYTVLDSIPCVHLLDRGYFQIESVASQTLSAITVSMWVYFPIDARDNCSEYPRFFWLGNTKNAYSFLCGTSTPDPGLNFQTNNSTNTWPSSNVKIEFGRWYHVCGVVENGTTIITYLDGIPSEEKNILNEPLSIPPKEAVVHINYITSDAGLNSVYIAAVRVYNRVLSEKEIITLSEEFTPYSN